MTGTLDDADLVWLDEVGLADIPQVGAKLARLGALRALGGQVPDAFVLTTTPSRRSSARPEPTWSTCWSVVGRARGRRTPQRVGAGFHRPASLPASLEQRIVEAFAELAERTGLGARLSTAVRSSGVTEDSLDASSPVEYDTYLGLRSAEGVLEHVRKCWGAATTPARSTIGDGGGTALGTRIAVGVMQLVDARVGGRDLHVESRSPATANRR